MRFDESGESEQFSHLFWQNDIDREIPYTSDYDVKNRAKYWKVKPTLIYFNSISMTTLLRAQTSKSISRIRRESHTANALTAVRFPRNVHVTNTTNSFRIRLTSYQSMQMGL